MITNRKVDIAGNAVNWLKFEMIKLVKSQPMKIFYKTDHNDDTPYKTIEVKKKGSKLTMKNMKLPLLYCDTRPISVAKFNDLNKLKQFLPPVDAVFYENLKTTEDDNNESDY